MRSEEEQRTLLQNKAMHLYFEMLANALNDAGFDIKKVLEMKTVDVPWTKTSVKEVLWRPVMEAMLNKSSTTDQSTIELSQVYEVLNRHTAEKLGVNVPWPDRFGK